MDPDATWRLLCETLRELRENPDDRETRVMAIAFLEALTTWLRMGGFPPSV